MVHEFSRYLHGLLLYIYFSVEDDTDTEYAVDNLFEEKQKILNGNHEYWSWTYKLKRGHTKLLF